MHWKYLFDDLIFLHATFTLIWAVVAQCEILTNFLPLRFCVKCKYAFKLVIMKPQKLWDLILVDLSHDNCTKFTIKTLKVFRVFYVDSTCNFLKLVSRKIWEADNFINFHTVCIANLENNIVDICYIFMIFLPLGHSTFSNWWMVSITLPRK